MHDNIICIKWHAIRKPNEIFPVGLRGYSTYNGDRYEILRSKLHNDSDIATSDETYTAGWADKDQGTFDAYRLWSLSDDMTTHDIIATGDLFHVIHQCEKHANLVLEAESGFSRKYNSIDPKSR